MSYTCLFCKKTFRIRQRHDCNYNGVQVIPNVDYGLWKKI